MVNIRPATESEVPRILELYRQLALSLQEAEEQTMLPDEHYRGIFSEIATRPDCDLLVAEDGDVIIASLALVIVPNLSHGGRPWAVIENVVVDETYRRRGIGRQIMQYAADRARAAGCYKVGLTSTKSRTGAHKFYQDLGYEASAEGFRLYF
jgi:GNAT superfamily N-acetyltransferase